LKKKYLPLILLLMVLLSCNKNSMPVPPPVNNGGNTTIKYTGTLPAVAQSENLGSPFAELSADSVYTANTPLSARFKAIPAGFENKIVSFYLPQGYMVVFAENQDGTGETTTIAAVSGPVKANLPARLRNNISFIRYSRINNPNKKGICFTNDAVVQNFASQWYYSWGLNKASYINQQYVPMTWGKGSCTDDNVKYLVERPDVDHLLSFNEPDNTSQSNMTVDTAVVRYKFMQQTGMRLGAPVVTQDQAFGAGKWLTNFMSKAQIQKLKIDFICVHWYDWGDQTNNGATDSLTAEKIFDRFTSYIQNVRAAYPNRSIWITEYNANINRTSEVVHKYFMKLSSAWLNNTSYVERYAYFFPASVPAFNPDNSLTPAGSYWKSLPTTKSFSGNILNDADLIN
jgi:hypothetical protein